MIRKPPAAVNPASSAGGHDSAAGRARGAADSPRHGPCTTGEAPAVTTPVEPDARLAEAERLARDGALPAAEAAYRRLVLDAPSDLARVGLALTLLRLGRMPEAEAEFRRAAESGAPDALLGLALCLRHRGAGDEARALLAATPLGADGHARVNRLVGVLFPRTALHAYWTAPPDPENDTSGYAAAPPARSAYLVDLLRRVLPPPARALEVGCNAGRNLAALHQAGYGPLAAVEISTRALAQFAATFPAAYAATAVRCGPAEDELPRLPDGAVDVVFTMAVLEHVHPDAESLFADVARVASRVVVTIEDEGHVTGRHFVRDYGAVFGALGCTALFAEPTPEALGLGTSFVTRAFRVPS
jgi:SAM-dependent methyltransferase